MKSTISPEEFARRAVGVPWRKWHASWEAMDCFGCIVMYHREVLGVELGEVPHTAIAEGFERARGWVECEAEAGATCWMSWRNGVPTHCGILLTASLVLHAEGSEGRAGSVRVSRLDAVARVHGAMRFYRYTPC